MQRTINILRTMWSGLLLATLLTTFVQGAWADATVTTESDLRTAVQSNQTVTLGADITLNDGRLDIYGKTVTLDLNGHTLTRSMTAPDDGGQVIMVENGGKLTITDKSGNSGRITGGWAYQGGGIFVRNASLTIAGGTITGNRASLKDGSGFGYGGGVEVEYGSTMTMTGGVITGNTAEGYGGGIYLDGDKDHQEQVALTMTGGSITGNTASIAGGGIYQWYCTVNMQGSPVVENNSADDYFLSNWGLITVTGAFTGGASIGVSTEWDKDYFTSSYSTHNSATPNTYFHVGSNRVTGTIGWSSDSKEAKLTKTGYKYIDHTWTQSAKTLTAEEKSKTSGEYTVLGSSAGWTALTNGGWFVVEGNINIAALVVQGTSNLILCDGASVTVTEGVKVESKSNAVLNIYGQAGNTGQLIATNSHSGAAGIGSGGGSDDGDAGIINIHGGTIDATGNKYGAGIGGGDTHSFGLASNSSGLYVYGGRVTAHGGEYAAGIGSGDKCTNGNAGYVTVYGGAVNAFGGSEGAGIGGGNDGAGAMFSIYGGGVTATGGYLAAGIGGGDAGIGGQSSFYGGTVSATGGYHGAGIGGGEECHGGYIDIYGGNITATGGEHSAGIGGGDDGGGGMIRIHSGNSVVNATGGDGGAGIGGGYNSGYGGNYDANDDGNSGTITIEGGNITATSISSAAGIGGGMDSHYCKVDISGGTVTAISKHDGAGIGTGAKLSGSSQYVDLDITISGGTVTAYSEGLGPGIGLGTGFYFGYSGDSDITKGEIRITGGTVIAGDISKGTCSGAGIGTAGFDLSSQSSSHMYGSIIISGGNVTATSKTGAGIGPGRGSKIYETGLISISGGTVKASSTTCSAIGKSENVDYTTGGGNEASDVTAQSTNQGTVMIQGSVVELSSGANFPAVYVEDASRLHLDNELMVKNNGTKVGRNDRASTLTGNNPTVKVEPCDHSAVDEGYSCMYCFKGSVTALSLADDGDNSELLIGYNGRTVSVTLSGRTLWQDGSWNTLCLPFDVTVSGSVLDARGVQAMTLNTGTSNLSGSTLTLNFDDVTDGTIPAGTPFIIKWADDGLPNIENPVFQDVTVSLNDQTPNGLNNQTIEDVLTFTGTYDPVVITEGGDNTLLYLGADNKLYYPNAAMTIGAFRAYFQLADGITASPNPSQGGEQSVRAFVLNFGEDDTQGVTTPLSPAKGAWSEASWYTIDGRRLMGKPTQKGVYISRGHKVVIK